MSLKGMNRRKSVVIIMYTLLWIGSRRIRLGTIIILCKEVTSIFGKGSLFQPIWNGNSKFA